MQKIGRGGNEGGEGKEEKEEEEEEEKEEEEEEKEEDEEDEEDEKDEEEEEDEAKRRGGGGLNQNKAKSTKHAGRPADSSGVAAFTHPFLLSLKNLLLECARAVT